MLTNRDSGTVDFFETPEPSQTALPTPNPSISPSPTNTAPASILTPNATTPAPTTVTSTNTTTTTTTATTTLDTPTFRDVTAGLGITQELSEQFGGACVADLDSDGNYDLILTYHHNEPVQVYYGQPGKRFKFNRSDFSFSGDVHGVSVAPRTVTTNEKLLMLSLGGGRGNNLRTPATYLFQPGKQYREITNEFGLGVKKSRGRLPLFMNMALKSSSARRDNQGGPDILIVNFLGNDPDLTHFAYENVHGNYRLRRVPGFERINEERAIVTDMENDGVMELVHFSKLAIFKLVSPFRFSDVTERVWPQAIRRGLQRSISAVVELDFNNDGFFDLYLARASPPWITPRGPDSVAEFGDVLLLNEGGSRYREVSATMNIPRTSNSMGVSAADFNNDGFIDIIIATFSGPDILLINEGGRKFRQVDPKTTKISTTRGANVLAVDYDLDGRVEYITGQAWRKDFVGNFRIMKNSMSIGASTHYLLVRVGNDPNMASTALNAVVTVFMRDGSRMVRRIGGNGADKGGSSFIDTVHFGVGKETMLMLITVKWTTGSVQSKKNVPADRVVKFGQ